MVFASLRRDSSLASPPRLISKIFGLQMPAFRGPRTPMLTMQAFLGLSKGKELRMSDPHVEVHPWNMATDLADSNAVGSLVELPVICG